MLDTGRPVDFRFRVTFRDMPERAGRDRRSVDTTRAGLRYPNAAGTGEATDRPAIMPLASWPCPSESLDNGRFGVQLPI